MTIQELAKTILTACESGAVDVTMYKTGHMLADLLAEIEIRAQEKPGYDVAWLEIVSEYCVDRLAGDK